MIDKSHIRSILESHEAWLDKKPRGERADLRGADLSCTDLRGARLDYALLDNADLDYCFLYGASLDMASMKDVSLHHASGAIYGGHHIDEGRDFYGVYGQQAIMVKADHFWLPISRAREWWKQSPAVLMLLDRIEEQLR